eukprot:540121-Prorocentrum_minimum.AAC.1
MPFNDAWRIQFSPIGCDVSHTHINTLKIACTVVQPHICSSSFGDNSAAGAGALGAGARCITDAAVAADTANAVTAINTVSTADAAS